MNPPPSHDVRYALDSGWRTHDGTTDGPQVVYAVEVHEADAEWLRLWLTGTVLSGDSARSDATILRLTALLDGAVQELDAEALARWNESSCYFNGGAVQVELVMWPGAAPSRVAVESVTAGEPVFSSRSICGPTDDRVLSNELRSGRYLPSGCTAWIFNDANKQFLMAGHCGASSSGVVQFNVPLSTSGGGLVNPPPEHQYPVEPSSIQAVNGGIGNDWCYFGTWPNTVNNQSAFQSYGQFYTVANAPTASGQTIRITGYGTTSAPVSATWNQVQKTHTGPYVALSGGSLQYQPDTTGGNSGSAVFNETDGVAIGIHTHGGCNTSGGANQGTAFQNAGLQAALANPRGICAPGFGVVVPPVYSAGDSNKAFGTLNFEAGAFTRIAILGINVEGMAYDRTRNVFWVSTTERALYTVNPENGTKTLVSSTNGSNRPVSGLGYDPATDTLFGIFQDGGRLLTIDKSTGLASPIGPPPARDNIGALDCDPATGVLYGIDDATGGSRLVTLDRTTGARTIIGNLGAGITDCNGLAFNPEDGFLYTVNAGNEQLLRVNPATGSATLVGATGVLWGGSFGLAASGAAPCPADFNGDDFVDLFDFDDFVTCFEGGTCPPGKSSDFNGDGFTDFFDFDEFVVAFEAGCP